MFDVLNGILLVILAPVQILIFAPIDLLLQQIPGISEIPIIINQMVYYVSNIPSAFVYLFHINPILWNSFFILFTGYIALSPTIQVIKSILGWWDRVKP